MDIFTTTRDGCIMPVAFILLNSDLGSEERVLESVRSIPVVKDARAIYGFYDIICRVETEDMAHLKQVINERVRKVDRIKATLTLIVAEESS